jgi:hypothetical protein
VTTLHPHLPLFENQGLGIALLSYAGALSWGLTADWERVPDLHELREALVRSFAELRELARACTAALAERAPRAEPSNDTVVRLAAVC